MRRDDERLRDILEAAGIIAGYLDGVDQAGFLAVPLLQDGIIRRLTIIGEAAASMTKGFRLRFVDVDWVGISDFRNFVVHEYFAVDLALVWKAAVREVPDLLPRVREILAELTESPGG